MEGNSSGHFGKELTGGNTMAEQAKISVIMPIYNGAEYIDQAMESVLSQSLYAIEIVVVEDGSKDDSIEKLREWEQKDHRVKVIAKKNEGVSVARNTGIQAATGEYITFLDVDDYLEKDAYERLVDALEQSGAQACLCSFFAESEREKEEVLLPWNTGTILKEENIWGQLIPWMIKVYPEDGISSNIFGSVWRLCVKKDALMQADVWFDSQLKIAEDFDFCIHLFSKLSDIVIVQEALYHYIRWEQTTLSVYRKNQFEEGIENQMRLKAFLQEQGKYEELKTRFIGSYVDVCIGSLVNFVRPGAPKYSIILKELKEVVNRIAEDGIYKELECVSLTRNQKLVLELIRRKMVRTILFFTKIRQIRKK